MIKKTGLLLVAAVMVAAVLTTGCSFNVGNTSPSPSASTMNTYDSAKGFVIKYSSDWTKDESNTTLAVLFGLPTNNKTENLNVQVVNLTSSDSLDTLTDEAMTNAESYENFTAIAANNTTLSANPAYKIVYAATIDGNFVKVQQVWTIKAGKAYIITYKAAPSNYDAYASTAQQMIDSFVIK